MEAIALNMEYPNLEAGIIYKLDGRSVTCKSLIEFPGTQKWVAKFVCYIRISSSPYSVEVKIPNFVLTDQSSELERLERIKYDRGNNQIVELDSEFLRFENTSRNKNAAAQILLESGWSPEKVAAALEYIEGGAVLLTSEDALLQ